MDNGIPTAYPYVVASSLEDGEGILVDLNSKKYYRLNETAVLVWRGVESRRTPAEIVGDMVVLYDVTRGRAAASVERILRDMRGQRLVQAR